jgi:uncharacterized protein (DUF934 family)
MRYIKDGVVTLDSWVRLAGDEPVPQDIATIASAEWLLAAPEPEIAARNAPLGVAWPNDKPVAGLVTYLPKLSLVALEFPTFRDGRAYTQARQLRERHGFQGEIRATGDVLRDQFLFMVRAGFDAFEVRKDGDAEAFAKALQEFTVFYQPTAAETYPGFRRRFSPAQAPFIVGNKSGA